MTHSPSGPAHPAFILTDRDAAAMTLAELIQQRAEIRTWEVRMHAQCLIVTWRYSPALGDTRWWAVMPELVVEEEVAA